MNIDKGKSVLVVIAVACMKSTLGCASDFEDKGTEKEAVGVSSDLAPISPDELARRQEMFRSWARAQRDRLTIVATTTTHNGQTIDWIPKESQVPGGKIETPPTFDPTVASAPDPKSSPSTARPQFGTPKQAHVGLEADEIGPPGTVPVVRFDVEGYLADVGTPPASIDEFEASRRPSPDRTTGTT
jgi:hypothetical protein